jgi:hypothetical protein
LDADLDAPDAEAGSLIQTLATRFVFPLAREAATVASGGAFKKQTAMSGILFGPPGTSKTNLAEIIADFLNWPLLLVDPSYLVQEGLDRVQAMANRLFSLLSMAEQVVVLLDEFDEMGRDRTANSDILSRFITTAMLPKLAAINKQKKIVFLLATNYVSGFDAAFARSGRFDMRLQVMQPNYASKEAKWPELGGLVSAAGADVTTSKSRIGELTFLETQNLVRLWNANTNQDAGALIQREWTNSTLRKPFEASQEVGAAEGPAKLGLVQSGDEKQQQEEYQGAPRNWAESCKADRKHMLIPAKPDL